MIAIVNLAWYLSYSKVAVKAAKRYPGQVSYLREPVMREIVPVIPKPVDANKYISSQPCPLYVLLSKTVWQASKVRSDMMKFFFLSGVHKKMTYLKLMKRLLRQWKRTN